MFKADIGVTIGVLFINSMGGGPSVPAQSPTPTTEPPAIIKKVPTELKKIQPVKYKTFARLKPIYVPPPKPAVSRLMPQGTYANTYEWGNCTWYVAGRLKVPGDLGNAATWAYVARTHGIKTGAPIVGSVAQHSRNYYGHVAIVVDTRPGEVKVSEMNVQGLGVVDEAWYPASYFENYIYF